MRPAVPLFALLVACGARSSLRADSKAADGSSASSTGGGSGSPSGSGSGLAGAGGASDSGAGATTGSGGSAPLACTSLSQNGPLVTLPTLGPGTSDNARFHWLDDSRIAVVHRPFDSVVGLRVGSTELAWTGSWPPAAGVPVELIANASESFAIDRAASPLVGLLAPPSNASGVAFGLVDPLAGGWQPSLPIDAQGDRAVFVRQGLGEYLVATAGTGDSPGGSSQLRIAWTDGTALRGPFDAGCHATGILADALAVDDGWLLARTSTALESCDPSTPAPTAPRLSVMRYAIEGTTFGTEMPLGNGSNQIALVARPGGAWLVHWLGTASIVAVAIDAAGQAVFGPIPIVSLTEDPFAFAVDRLDDGLAVVAYDKPSEGPTSLQVIVTDSSGTTIASTSIASPPRLTTPPQVAFDPVTRQLLVGFAGITAAKQSIHLARFACP